LAVAALLALGGLTGVTWWAFGSDADDDDAYVRATPCPLDDTHTPIGSQVHPYVSLEEARRLAQFELLLPDDLPDGVAVNGVLLAPNPLCPDEQVARVEIMFEGRGYQFRLTETDGEVSVHG